MLHKPGDRVEFKRRTGCLEDDGNIFAEVDFFQVRDILKGFDVFDNQDPVFWFVPSERGLQTPKIALLFLKVDSVYSELIQLISAVCLMNQKVHHQLQSTARQPFKVKQPIFLFPPTSNQNAGVGSFLLNQLVPYVFVTSFPPLIAFPSLQLVHLGFLVASGLIKLRHLRFLIGLNLVEEVNKYQN